MSIEGEREKKEEGLLKIVNRGAVIDARIKEEEYPLVGLISYVWYFPTHLYRQLKNRFIEAKINRKI